MLSFPRRSVNKHVLTILSKYVNAGTQLQEDIIYLKAHFIRGVVPQLFPDQIFHTHKSS